MDHPNDRRSRDGSRPVLMTPLTSVANLPKVSGGCAILDEGNGDELPRQPQRHNVLACALLTFPLCVHGQDSCGIQAKNP